MIYYAEERKDGYAVIGKGNDRSANIELTEKQADKRAHQLANRDGHGVVEWKVSMGSSSTARAHLANTIDNRLT